MKILITENQLEKLIDKYINDEMKNIILIDRLGYDDIHPRIFFMNKITHEVKCVYYFEDFSLYVSPSFWKNPYQMFCDESNLECIKNIIKRWFHTVCDESIKEITLGNERWDSNIAYELGLI